VPICVSTINLHTFPCTSLSITCPHLVAALSNSQLPIYPSSKFFQSPFSSTLAYQQPPQIKPSRSLLTPHLQAICARRRGRLISIAFTIDVLLVAALDLAHLSFPKTRVEHAPPRSSRASSSGAWWSTGVPTSYRPPLPHAGPCALPGLPLQLVGSLTADANIGSGRSIFSPNYTHRCLFLTLLFN
jgi:hypothetical protein